MPLYSDGLVPSVASCVPIPDPQDPSVTSTAAWYNLDWNIFSKDGPQSIKTIVASSSDHSLIQYREVKRLGLVMHPLLEGEYELDGSYGGRERVTKFVEVGLECPVIGLERVEVGVLVVRCKQVVGLLVGLRMIDEYNIAEKISATYNERARTLPFRGKCRLLDQSWRYQSPDSWRPAQRY
ncbi:hypothetical protein BR93DRAFT_932155 [Coniochaeta sp. PMI_546]|nr:hypothetical protein BR93DRAFT_932155 [Coniochaeta sp. PMI_546]